MGQEDGKKWAAAAHSQPTIPKSDRLLGADDALSADGAPTGAEAATAPTTDEAADADQARKNAGAAAASPLRKAQAQRPGRMRQSTQTLAQTLAPTSPAARARLRPTPRRTLRPMPADRCPLNNFRRHAQPATHRQH